MPANRTGLSTVLSRVILLARRFATPLTYFRFA